MSRDQRPLLDYLAHVLEAIEPADRYTADMDEMAFLVRANASVEQFCASAHRHMRTPGKDFEAIRTADSRMYAAKRPRRNYAVLEPL